MSNQTNDFYKRLEKQLSDSSVWPSLYKFKFILKSDPLEITNLKNMFNDIDANISSNLSSSKNCKKLAGCGIPLGNFLYVPSTANLIDMATRPQTMEVKNLELFLGAWDSSKLVFERNSKFFGGFKPDEFFWETLPPKMFHQA